MKRPASTPDHSQERPATVRRQEPVSCQVCRKKKLKCSRTFPCSNCVSRGLECQPPSQWSESQVRSSSVAASSDSSILARVLERLQRLEDIVLKNDKSTVQTSTNEQTSSPQPHAHEDVVQNKIFHSIGRSDGTPQANVVDPEEEVRDLEITGSRQANTDDDENSFVFASAEVSQIVFDLNLRAPTLTSMYVTGSTVVRRICLPDRKEAHTLFKSYARSLGSWYHIYHKRTIEAILDGFYHQVACGHPPKLHHVALLLSIFASGSYFQAFATWPESVFTSSSEANQLSLHWKRNTLDILNHIERASIPSSVEQLQATIIISLITQNFEGLSKTYWLLHGTSITLARDLSIHVLDHPTRAKSGNIVENEVKRRIWWYLATTDWLLGSMPSPLEGTYSINPRHSFVKRPLNIDDDDLWQGSNPQDKPLSEPTEMSYFLVRTEGGEVCRVLADLVHPLAAGVNSVDYDEIVALERKTASITENMPFYFQLDEESRKRTEPYLQKYPQLATQRYLLQQGLHCHRSRIHRSFLIRGSMDARFNFSRMACLESVRKSLEIRRLLNQEKRGVVLPIAKLNFVLYHVFMAALTLALDLCFNKSATEAEDQDRRTELREACLMLQDARTEMASADRFLTPLMELLRKHRIQLQDSGPQNMYLTPSGSAGTPNIQDRPSLVTQGRIESTEKSSAWNHSVAPDPNLELDSLWEEFANMVPDSNVVEWDNFMADLDYASLYVGV